MPDGDFGIVNEEANSTMPRWSPMADGGGGVTGLVVAGEGTEHEHEEAVEAEEAEQTARTLNLRLPVPALLMLP